MIILKVIEAGYIIEIPGLRVVRSPVNLDISKVGINIVLTSLKKSGIEKYKIIYKNSKGKKKIYTQKDFIDVEKIEIKQDDTNSKINKLETMMKLLLTRELSKSSIDKEQINNKLDNLENMFKSGIQRVGILEGDEVENEDINSFIPEVDISDMKLNSDNIKTVKQDSNDNEEASDILSGLIKRG